MQKVKLFAVIAALFSGVTQSAAEDVGSGNHYLQPCLNFQNHTLDTYDSLEQGVCMGVIIATLYLSPEICAPKGVTAGQGLRVVVSYMERHPDQLHAHITQLAKEAMSSAWPCPKSNR